MVYSGRCGWAGVKVITNGADDATVMLYDSASASGKKLDETTVVGADNYGGFVTPDVIECTIGIYASITGTGASCFIYYVPMAPPYI